MLDPFQPERPDDVKRLEALQLDVHENFKALVANARGDRLKADDPAIFSGEFWAGKGALERGLIDGIADFRSKMRGLFGKDVKFRLVTARTPWWRFGGGAGASSRLNGALSGISPAVSHSFGAGFAAEIGEGLIAAAENRSLWSRFGL